MTNNKEVQSIEEAEERLKNMEGRILLDVETLLNKLHAQQHALQKENDKLRK